MLRSFPEDFEKRFSERAPEPEAESRVRIPLLAVGG
jgi:hypothetical protein